MGFFTRVLIPRKVRRVAHPVRAVKRTVIPRPVRQAQGIARSVAHPVSAAGFMVENAAVRAVKGGGRRLPSGYASRPRPATPSAKQQKAQEVVALAGFLNDLASVHKQEFSDFVAPDSWTPETMKRFVEEVKKELNKGVPPWSRSRRAAARAALALTVESRLSEMREAARALEQNAPLAVVTSLEVAFEDNQTPAFPISCEGDAVTVALLVRDVDRLLGNQRPGVTKAGNPSLTTWPKVDRNDYYLNVILSDVVATAKEGFANAPGLETFNVVVVRQTETSDGLSARNEAVMQLQLARDAITSVDWKSKSPLDVLTRIPFVVSQNRQTHALEALTRAEDPDITRVLDLLDKSRSSAPRRPDWTS